MLDTANTTSSPEQSRMAGPEYFRTPDGHSREFAPVSLDDPAARADREAIARDQIKIATQPDKGPEVLRTTIDANGAIHLARGVLMVRMAKASLQS